MKPRSITSTANTTVKDAARLKRKKHRHSRRRFLAEGEDLLEAAIHSGIVPRQVFVLDGAPGANDLLEKVAVHPGTAVYLVNSQVMGKLSNMGGNSRVVAEFDLLDTDLPPAGQGVADGVYIYLAGLADPGNVGAIIRSAAALGGAGVIFSPDTADPYGPRSVQATMGSIFSLPLYHDTAGIPALLYWAADHGLTPVAADHRWGKAAWECDLTAGLLLMMGAERAGLPDGLREHAAFSVKVPQRADIDSLNVAMAATAILYEAARQRTGE